MWWGGAKPLVASKACGGQWGQGVGDPVEKAVVIAIRLAGGSESQREIWEEVVKKCGGVGCGRVFEWGSCGQEGVDVARHDSSWTGRG